MSYNLWTCKNCKLEKEWLFKVSRNTKEKEKYWLVFSYKLSAEKGSPYSKIWDFKKCFSVIAIQIRLLIMASGF